MLPSSTVENYLKAIHQAQSRIDGERDARADGTVVVRARGRAGNGDDHGEDAGGFGAGGLRAVFRRQVDARRARSWPRWCCGGTGWWSCSSSA